MIHGLYQSAAGMLTSEYRQDVVANNLANADTPGFKREIAVFAERRPASEAGVRRGASDELLRNMTGGIWLGRTETDFSEGTHVQTDNPLDVALDGPGFLMVDVNGQKQLTRDGRLVMTPEGQLVSALDGAPVLGVGGAAIQLNPLSSTIAVTEEGRILQDGQPVAQLAVVDVPDARVLRKQGAVRFSFNESQTTPGVARLKGGFIESSSAEAVPELVNMIETSRAYQMNARMIELQDQSIGRLLSVLTRA
ncbi:Flagellar basal-body rod protein FlgG [Phycisphaerae bacterium RAS1]|nr:Flagellar basal-body rod protein FlgG [Phycisphaerae bacterium RAS1]